MIGKLVAGFVGKTYREESNGVNGQLINLSVTHDCNLYDSGFSG